MSGAAPHPRMHGLTHVAGGPDPVPGLMPSFTTYADLILAEPSLWAYWPLDDADGDAREVVAARDLTADEQGGFELAYRLPGPIVEDATAFAIGFDGNDGQPLQGAYLHRAETLAGFTDSFTFEVWLYSEEEAGSVSYLMTVAASLTATSVVRFLRRNSSGSIQYFQTPGANLTGGTAPAGAWTHIAVTFDEATLTARLYVAGVEVGSGSSVAHVNSAVFTLGRNPALMGVEWVTGRLSNCALYTEALDADTIAMHAAGEGVAGGPGWVLGIDENGDPVWIPPPAPDVTVNGDDPAAAGTPLPTPAPPPTDPGTGGPDLDDWIVDQPFTGGGGTFTVPDKKWTTIPFTTPRVERNSNVTGSGTVWTTITGTADDPGWVDPATPHAILIPHDMEFLGDPVDWYQVCLRLESPQVLPESSYRALRIFETTHQKTLVQANSRRADCCEEHGAVNVYTSPGSTVWADGDTGAFHNGGHDNIMFVPNAGYAFYMNGNDWLPKNGAGNRILTAGMRLVAQVWHDAGETLTFSCAVEGSGSFGPYRPHFVFCQQCERAWGSPWSDWPTY